MGTDFLGSEEEWHRLWTATLSLENESLAQAN
jgi:hypothetical protein